MALPFPAPFRLIPLPGRVGNQREGVGARGRRQRRAPVRAGAAGPLGMLFSPSCSPHLLTLPRLEERPFAAAGLLSSALLQSMCLTTQHTTGLTFPP